MPGLREDDDDIQVNAEPCTPCTTSSDEEDDQDSPYYTGVYKKTDTRSEEVLRKGRWPLFTWVEGKTEVFHWQSAGNIDHNGNPAPYLDVAKYANTSVANSAEDMIRFRQPIPFACYLPKKGKEKPSFYYFVLRFKWLCAAMRAIHQELLVFCATVCANRPCHVYGDLDAGPRNVGYESVAGRHDDVIAEWMRLVPQFWQQTFKRLMDLSRIQWETACRDGKFSLHVHVPSTAFVNVQHQKQFWASFILWLKEHHPHSILLAVPCNVFIDLSVYSNNRNFRIVGQNNCKPNSTLLPYDHVAKRVVPFEKITNDHLFYGLITHNIAEGVVPVEMPEYKPTASKKRKAPGDKATEYVANAAGDGAVIDCPVQLEAEEALALSPYNIAIRKGMDAKGWLKPKSKANRVCFYRDANGTQRVHATNKPQIRMKPDHSVWIHCHSNECQNEAWLMVVSPKEEREAEMRCATPTLEADEDEEMADAVVVKPPTEEELNLPPFATIPEPAAAITPTKQRGVSVESFLDDALSKINTSEIDNWDRLMKACIKARCTKEQLTALTEGNAAAAARVDTCWQHYSTLSEEELPRTHVSLMTLLKSYGVDAVEVDLLSMKLTAAKKKKPATPPARKATESVVHPEPLVASFNTTFDTSRTSNQLPWRELTAWWKANPRAAYCPEFVDNHLVPFLNTFWKYVKDTALVYIKCEDKDGRPTLMSMTTDKFDKAYANFVLDGLRTKFPTDAGLTCKFWFTHDNREHYDCASYSSPYARTEHKPHPGHLSLFPSLRIPHSYAEKHGDPYSQDAKDYVELINDGVLAEEPDAKSKNFFWKTMASHYRRPGYLLYHGIALAGEKGAGKTYPVETALANLLGESLTAVAKQRSWFGEFNAPFEKAMSGCVDEYSHDPSMINDIKYQVCAKRFTLRKMRCDPSPNQQSVTNLWWTCNGPDEFDDELLGRRVSCYQIGKGIQGDRWKKWLNRQWKWVDIAAYLIACVDISNFDPEIAEQRPDTVGNQRQLASSMASCDAIPAWWKRVLEDSKWEHWDCWVLTRALFAAYLGPNVGLTVDRVEKEMPLWLGKWGCIYGLLPAESCGLLDRGYVLRHRQKHGTVLRSIT